MPDFGFQDVLIDRLVANGTGGPSTFIQLDAGLGKTRCAIRAAQRLGVRRAIVACPNIGLVSWPAELEKWAPGTLYSTVSDPELIPNAARAPDAPHWIVAPYSEISRWPRSFVAAAERFKPELLVLDEAQALANLDTARTQAVYGPRADKAGGMTAAAEMVWPMSGTPAPSYTSELWTHISALAPETIIEPGRNRAMSYQEFLRRYSTTRISVYGQHVTGSVNTAELRARTAPFFHRVRKRDVLTDLPPVLWTAEPLPVTSAQASNHLEIPEGLDDADLFTWLRGAYPHGSSERKAMGLAKIAGAVEWADAFLQSCNRQLLLFAWHTDVVLGVAQGLRERGHTVGCITGDTPTAERVRAVKDFQSGVIRVNAGQMVAMGTSVTLTAASDIGFIEDDWIPGNMEQAAGRADRIGQTRGVVARVLYVPGSKDERIAQARVRKARELDKLFN